MSNKKKRYGNQKPTKSKVLPFKKGRGTQAIKNYEASGRKAMPWQKCLTKVILAKNKNGDWVHMKFGFSVPRQNGKNEVVVIRELEGLLSGEKMLHTAHRTTTSGTAFERLLAVLDEANYIEDEDYTKIKAIGRENIKFISTGGVINFRTRTSTGGLGESYDLLVIDEAQEYTDDQESALKYTIASSPNPQTIYLGTPPTAVSGGTVFPKFRGVALSNDSEDMGWAEWSVDSETDTKDVDSWYLTNPSLGYRVQERTVRSEVNDDSMDFNIQRLGLWYKYSQKSAISLEDWESMILETKPNLVGEVFVGIKYGIDNKNVSLGVAVKDINNNIFIEVIDHRPIRAGNDWILSFLKTVKPTKVVVDGSRQTVLAEDMRNVKIKKPELIKVSDFIEANVLFEEAMYQGTIKHKNQLPLMNVATNVDKRPIGKYGGFGYDSQIEEFDITLLDSVILAHYLCSKDKGKKEQLVRY